MSTTPTRHRHTWSVAILIILILAAVGLQTCGNDEDEVTPTPQPSQVAHQAKTTSTLQPQVTTTRKPGTPQPKPKKTRTITPAPTQVKRTPTPKPQNTAGPISAAASKQTWLVMLYEDADDEILEKDMFVDLNEAERVGSNARVQIVVQMDRYKGGFSGDGDWTTCKRFYVTQDEDLNHINSQQIADLGEVDMSDAKTLIDFASWAMTTYPADKYVLVLSDHGAGWPGGWSDPKPAKRALPDVPLAEGFGAMLYTMDLDQALDQIRANTGVDKLELVGLDACLMADAEVFTALAPHAHYAVASQETEPSLGWAYEAWLGNLAQHPEINGAQLAQSIVNSYVDQDVRIVDDQARAAFSQERYGLLSLLYSDSAEDLRKELGTDVTLSAIDLAAIPDVLTALDSWVKALPGINQNVIAGARSHAQAFTSVFGDDVPESYIDLASLVRLLQKTGGNSRSDAAAERLLAAIQKSIIAERHGEEKSGATGMSIYFPNSRLYKDPQTGADSYTIVAGRFAENSLWDDFLAFHYADQPLSTQAKNKAVPPKEARTIQPGKGEITIAPLELSTDLASADHPVTVKTTIQGTGIAYVYLFVGHYNETVNAIRIEDIDYIDGDDTKEVDGVLYPDYGEGDVPIELDWEPTIYAVSDGQALELALVRPEEYGATYEDTVYAVDGIYQSAVTGDKRYAVLHFRGDVMQDLLGYPDTEGKGAPHEIVPQPGDTFTIQQQYLSLDENVSEEDSLFAQDGGMLTFGQAKFTWEEMQPEAGGYVIGILVEDMDGNIIEQYDAVGVM